MAPAVRQQQRPAAQLRPGGALCARAGVCRRPGPGRRRAGAQPRPGRLSVPGTWLPACMAFRLLLPRCVPRAPGAAQPLRRAVHCGRSWRRAMRSGTTSGSWSSCRGSRAIACIKPTCGSIGAPRQGACRQAAWGLACMHLRAAAGMLRPCAPVKASPARAAPALRARPPRAGAPTPASPRGARPPTVQPAGVAGAQRHRPRGPLGQRGHCVSQGGGAGELCS